MAKIDDDPLAEEDYKIIHRAADRKVPVFSAVFFDVFGKFARNIRSEDIQALINIGAFDVASFGIPWNELRPLLKEHYEPEIFRTIIDAADRSNAVFNRTISEAVGTKVEFSFDATNSRVRSYLDSEVGVLITEMTSESQKTVRQMVTRAQLNETKASKLTRDIKRNIGLRTDQEQALTNFENGLLENKGLKASQRTKMVNDYRNRLLGQRARLIARTETMRAANFGFMEGYQQAADEGLIDRMGTLKEWIVTPDDRLCATCRPMDGERVPLPNQWKVTVYTESKSKGRQAKGTKFVRIPNEIHPNCRCAMKVIPKKANLNIAI